VTELCRDQGKGVHFKRHACTPKSTGDSRNVTNVCANNWVNSIARVTRMERLGECYFPDENGDQSANFELNT